MSNEKMSETINYSFLNSSNSNILNSFNGSQIRNNNSENISQFKTTREKFIPRLPKRKIVHILFKGADKQLERLENHFLLLFYSDLKNKESEKSCHRYPKRNLKHFSYKEDISSDDEFQIFEESIFDVKEISSMDYAAFQASKSKVSDRTLPMHLVIRPSTTEVSLGVWTEVLIRPGIVFGPYKGRIFKSCERFQNTGYSWEFSKDNKIRKNLKGYSKQDSNWMRFVNCGEKEQNQNLIAFQWKNEIYYKTYKPILPYQELLVWYSEVYATKVEIKALLTTELVLKEEINETVSQDVQANIKENCKCDLKTHKNKLRDHKFRCRFCGKTFLRSHNFRSHQKVHDVEKPFTCDVCGKAFKWNQALRVHGRIHTGERPFRCSVCNKDFVQLSNLKTHQRMHSAQKPYKCPHCYYRSSQSQHLSQHIIVRHTKQYPLTCPECSKGFIRPSRLRDHVEKKHSGRQRAKKRRDNVHEKLSLKQQYDCYLCNYKCSKIHFLTKHMISKHTDVNSYECSRCTGVFYTLKEFTEHSQKIHKSGHVYNVSPTLNLTSENSYLMNIDEEKENFKTEFEEMKEVKVHEIDHRAGKKVFKCPNCEYTCYHYRRLSQHIICEHTKYYPYTCRHCGKGFFRSIRLKNHVVKFHRDIKENKDTDRKPYSCPDCDFACRKSGILSQHVIEQHTHDYPYVCPQCEEGFIRPKYLREHFAKMHARVKPDNQPSGKQITQSTNLEKRHKCPHCDQMCCSIQELSQHVIAAHTTNHSFPCCQCKKHFKTPIRLRNHFKKLHVVLTHRTKKNEGTFKCPHCQYCCAKKQHLTQHIIAKHTKEYPLFCPGCGKEFTGITRFKHHVEKCHSTKK